MNFLPAENAEINAGTKGLKKGLQKLQGKRPLAVWRDILYESKVTLEGKAKGRKQLS